MAALRRPHLGAVPSAAPNRRLANRRTIPGLREYMRPFPPSAIATGRTRAVTGSTAPPMSPQ